MSIKIGKKFFATLIALWGFCIVFAGGAGADGGGCSASGCAACGICMRNSTEGIVLTQEGDRIA